MKQIYGISKFVSGVYLLTNKITNKQYVGSSVDITSRLALHFNRECRKYPNHPLYKDIRKYGRDNFKWMILEECEQSKLITREQYYFDLIQPEYNQIRPCGNNFQNKKVQRLGVEGSLKPEVIKKRRKLYNTDKYFKVFREVQRDRMTSVHMIKNCKIIKTFDSLMDTQRWLNENTTYKGKNKASKIREVCLGKRNSAFGFKWAYVTENKLK